jgi:hypothetical protein
MEHSSIAGVNREILNNMTSSNINSSSEKFKNIKPEKITADTVATGEDLLIEWDFSYDTNDLLTVDILYKEKGKGDNYIILDTVANHNRYYLNFSDEFVSVNNDIFDVILTNSDDAIIVN